MARADDDALAPYRERFRAGMERYKTGNIAEAIQYWEPIYREIGPQKGYRLSFDLARCYEGVGESTRAAERYESFLSELAALRAAGGQVESLVEREEKEAHDRLEQLKATKGRIRVDPQGRPILAQIDLAEPRLGGFVAYVAPGSHVVVFSPGSADADEHRVSVKVGEMVEVTPKPLPPPPPQTKAATALPFPPPPPNVRTVREHPFSPAVLYVAAGVTVASAAVPIVLFLRANAWVSTYRSSADPREKNNIASDYGSVRTAAYASLAIPAGLAVITGGLATWYFAGTRERQVVVGLPFVAPLQGGAAAGVTGRF